MELFLLVLSVLGLVILGFVIAELQNAILEKQVKGGVEYFSWIGVTFTQKDAQRFILAIVIGICIVLIFPNLYESTLFEIKGYPIKGSLIYTIIGYAPVLFLNYIQKKVKEKS